MTASVSQLPLSALRQRIRENVFTDSTSGLAKGYLQANLVILPAEWANEFLLFCQRNPVACPLIGMTEPGAKNLAEIGLDIDISTDVPEYHVFYDGQFELATPDLTQHWRDDLVTFVLGCSFSFEEAMLQTGLSVRNIDQQCNCLLYTSPSPRDRSLSRMPSSA